MSSSSDFEDLGASTGAAPCGFDRAPSPVDAPVAVSRSPRSPESPTRPLRVVVVDDNADAADSLAMLLELLGHQVWTSHDGPDGLATIAARGPDAVILDIGLPGMDGFAVARAARARPGAEGLFIAALSGWGQADDRRRSHEAGADAHLDKPVGAAELVALIAEVQRRRAG